MRLKPPQKIAELDGLDEVTEALNERLDNGIGDSKTNYLARVLVLAIREQTLQLERTLRDA